jgi:hypothetical protein
MINAHDDELEESIESCETWEWYGGGLVVIGVFATVAIAAWHPLYNSWLEQWGSAISDSLVAIGVAVEIRFGQMAGLRHNELRRRSDIIVATANERAAEASQRARDAELRLALLEKKVTPRVVSDESGRTITERIAPFALTKFSISHDPAAEKSFIDALIIVLQRANWTWRGFRHIPTLGMLALTNQNLAACNYGSMLHQRI